MTNPFVTFLEKYGKTIPYNFSFSEKQQNPRLLNYIIFVTNDFKSAHHTVQQLTEKNSC